jgi:hypothetical protein
MFMPRYVGLDLHKELIEACFIGEQGKIFIAVALLLHGSLPEGKFASNHQGRCASSRRKANAPTDGNR